MASIPHTCEACWCAGSAKVAAERAEGAVGRIAAQRLAVQAVQTRLGGGVDVQVGAHTCQQLFQVRHDTYTEDTWEFQIRPVTFTGRYMYLGCVLMSSADHQGSSGLIIRALWYH